MSTTASLTILDLNDYCLKYIFKYLETVDRINVGRVSNRFDEIIAQIIGCGQFNFHSVYETLSLDIAKEAFTKYGPKIRDIFMQFDAVDDMVPFYYLVSENCHNIKKVHYNFPYYVDHEIMEMMFKASNGIEWLYCNARELFDQNLLLIGNLAELKYLNVEENRDISGAYLSRLTKLKELNLGGCSGLESKHFIDICRAVKLRNLNISECDSLNNDSFRILPETQVDLESLVLSTSYDARNIELVANLKSLKHLRVDYLHRKADYETRILDCVAAAKGNDLESLEIERPCSLKLLDKQAILKLRNLRKFTLSACKELDDDFLKELSNSCRKLETINISECSKLVTNQGIIELVKNLTNLKELNLQRCDQFDDTLFQSLSEIKIANKEKMPLLTVHTFGTKINRNIAKTAEYEKLRNRLKLTFWLHSF